MNVNELQGAELDAAVAKAEGYGAPEPLHNEEADRVEMWMPHATLPPFPVNDWRPSTAWVQGGPIIERERIGLIPQWNTSGYVGYAATCMPGAGGKPFSFGPTPLIAAMRAYVQSKT